MKKLIVVVAGLLLLGASACASTERGVNGTGGVNTKPVPIGDADSGTGNVPVDTTDGGSGGGGGGPPGIITKTCTGEDTISIEDNDAAKAALAMGLCPASNDGSDDDWGLVSARYTTPDGNGTMAPLSHGILSTFGDTVKPLAGSRMLVLSSGRARHPGDPGYKDGVSQVMGTESDCPPGFPMDFAGCDVEDDPFIDNTVALDGAALEIRVRAPKTAKSVRFNVNFYTHEFPTFVCSSYNDFFVALQSPAPAGAHSGNIAFDTQGNPISVNNAYVQVCEPQNAGGKPFACALGSQDLQGTGFEEHAASGWLEVVSPVEPGQEFTLRFAVWDVGDENWDSTVLIDNVRFDVEETEGPVIVPI